LKLFTSYVVKAELLAVFILVPSKPQSHAIVDLLDSFICFLPVLQVDVRALKEIIWGSLTTALKHAPGSTSSRSNREEAMEHDWDSGEEAAAGCSGQDTEAVNFAKVLEGVPEKSGAGQLSDLSVHMCFICLLHLANEKGLVIKSQPDLRTLTIAHP
jgi:hypothetical protein